jgi:hypothetical protein
MKIFGGGFFGDSSGSRMKSGLSADRPVAPKHGEQFANGTLGIVEIYTADGWSGDQNVVGAIPFGGEADRPIPGVGQPFFNGDRSRLELFTPEGGWQNIVQETPGLESVSGIYLESTASSTLGLHGTNFSGGARVSAIGTDGVEVDADVVTVSSSSSISATFSGLLNANGPYDMKITNTSNLYVTLDDALSVDAAPVWSIQSGSLGTYVQETALEISLLATDLETSVEFSLTSGVLPIGVSLDQSTGVLSGTLENLVSSTTYSFSVSASDGQQSVDRSFSISVTDIGPSWVTEPGALVRFSKDIEYLATIQAVDDDGISSYSITLGSLPAGLSLDSATGEISGIAPTSTDALFTVRATDNGGSYADRQFSLNNTVPSWVTTSGLITDYVSPDVAYSTTLVANDDGEVLYSILSGSLPVGLSLDPPTGEISGTVSSVFADVSFSVRVEDEVGNYEDRSFVIHVQPAFATVAGQVAKDSQLQSIVSPDLAASYGLVSGILPAGISMSSSGLFSGTPTEAGTFTFTVSLTDNLGIVVNREFSIVTTGGPQTETFVFTGAAQAYTIPSNRPLQFDVYGASGGRGGAGGRTYGTFKDSSMITGNVLQIFVGGVGAEGSEIAGGFNGGGRSGGTRANEGSGGGASDIRTGTSPNERIVVAGGGGGAGGYAGSAGGLGGGSTGGNGGAGQGGGGGGGTQNAGGSGGSSNGGSSSQPGGFGVGGTGGSASNAGGGGGGGGWYGGGGGGADTDSCCADGGGGGGGSSYANSSYGTGTTLNQGGRTGDGLVTISYTQFS